MIGRGPLSVIEKFIKANEITCLWDRRCNYSKVYMAAELSNMDHVGGEEKQRCSYEKKREKLSLIPGILLKRGNGANYQKFWLMEGKTELNLWVKLVPKLKDKVHNFRNVQSLSICLAL